MKKSIDHAATACLTALIPAGMARRTHRETAGAFPAFLSLLAFALAASLSSCDSGTGIMVRGRAWVAIDPVQCLGNPWEQDWLATHPHTPYPEDPDAGSRIIRIYYARFGVDVEEIISVPKYPVTCRACSCPRGDALYLNVRGSDVAAMLRLGFREESPFPPPFPRDTTLLGGYRYTGYDSAGTGVLFTGTLDFRSRDSSQLTGAWYLQGPGEYGPQAGTGDFVGWIHGNEIGLNLNPDYVDNNVLLHGRLNAGVYAGRWDQITIAGVVYSGSFVAVKLERE